MDTLTLAVGTQVTVSANPSDAGGFPGAVVVNGPNWIPSDSSKIGVTPTPGNFSPTAVVRGLSPGVSTLTIEGFPAVENAVKVTKVLTVTVTVGPLAQFNPTATPPVPIPA